MKALIILFNLVSFGSISIAQNLVKNPSFEDYNACPFSTNQITGNSNSLFIMNNLSKSWTDPNRNSSDFFHSCDEGQVLPSGEIVYLASTPNNAFGFQIPKSGKAYAGLYLYSKYSLACNSSDFLQGELSSKLIYGRNYCSGFWTSLADNMRFYLYSIGMYFNNRLIDTVSNNPNCSVVLLDGFLSPQITNDVNFLGDTSNWTIFSKVYTPIINNQQFIIIGNFTSIDSTILMDKMPNKPLHSSQISSYYYIDDVFVYEQKPIWVYGGDVTICDTITYVLRAEQAPEFVWWEISQPSVWLSTRDTLALPPGVGGTYVVR